KRGGGGDAGWRSAEEAAMVARWQEAHKGASLFRSLCLGARGRDVGWNPLGPEGETLGEVSTDLLSILCTPLGQLSASDPVLVAHSSASSTADPVLLAPSRASSNTLLLCG
ncbi:hypothetical protein L7F22_024660, partial [Adiantum nelumboides]|nr:hypothetical protein [Adiantum nelumboides]